LAHHKSLRELKKWKCIRYRNAQIYHSSHSILSLRNHRAKKHMLNTDTELLESFKEFIAPGKHQMASYLLVTLSNIQFRFFTLFSSVRAHLKRTRAALELLETEKTYVEDLEKIINIFQKPVHEACVLEKHQEDELFGNIKFLVYLPAFL